MARKLTVHQVLYEMRHTKMAKWMENVEKTIACIMAQQKLHLSP